MVVTARVHATRHLDLDLTEIVEVVEIIEALLDLLRHAQRARIGETAEIQPRARDHVRQRADVRHREPEAAQLAPDLVQIDLAHVRKQQVLVVRGANQPEAHALGEGGDGLHLLRCHVSRVLSVRLQRDEHRPISGDSMRPSVVAVPGLEVRVAPGGGFDVRQRLVGRRREMRTHAIDFDCFKARCTRARGVPFGFHLLAKARCAQ